MPSPFPGMDPFPERATLWPDFGHNFIGALRQTIHQGLVPDYYARVDARYWTPENPDPPYQLRLIHRASRTVVTVVRLLGGSGREVASFAAPTEAVFEPVNLVEIDLLRRKLRTPGGEAMSHPASDYLATVTPFGQQRLAGVWPISIREPLPAIAIPTRSGEASATANLQHLFETVYERAAYEADIDYASEPVPPLTPDQARWADELLRAKRLR